MNNKIFEITHDSLASKIWEKVSADDRKLIEVKAFIITSYESYKSRKALLTEEDLSYITPYEPKLKLDDGELDLIQKSRQRLFRRKAFLIAVLCVIIAILSFATIYSFNARNKAQVSQLNAENATKKLVATNYDLENQKRAADSMSRVAQAKTREAQESADTANEAKLKAYQSALLAQNSKKQTEAQKIKTQKLLDHTGRVLTITKILEKDPTQAIDSAYKLYPTIDDEEKLLKSVLRQTIYSSFATILYENKKDIKEPIRTFAVDNKKAFAVIAGDSNNILYYDIISGNIKHLENTTRLPVIAIAISENSKAFVTIDQGNNMTFWDKNKPRGEPIPLGKNVADVKALKKQNLLVIAYSNGDMDLYDFAGNLFRSVPSENLLDIESVRVVENKSIDFLTISGNNTITTWNLDNLTDSNRITVNNLSEESIKDVDISPDNLHIGIATDKKVAIYRLTKDKHTGENIVSLNSASPVEKIALLNSNEIIFSAADGDLVYYNVQTGSKKNLQNASGKNSVAEINKVTNPSVFVTGGNDGIIKFWNTVLTEPIVFDFTTYSDSKKATSEKDSRYTLDKDAKDSVLVLTEKTGQAESKFYLNSRAPSHADDTKLSLATITDQQKASTTNVVLIDDTTEVQFYSPIIKDKQEQLKIIGQAISDNRKYVLLKLRSKDQYKTYYVVYPTFLSVESFIENKKNYQK